MKKLIVIAASFLAFQVLSPLSEAAAGEAPPAVASGSRLKLLSFRFQQESMVQSGGGFYSGGFRYTPYYGLSDDMGIRLSLGPTIVKNRIGEISPVLELDALFSKSFGAVLGGEVGAGYHHFLLDGGLRLSFGGNITYKWNLWLIDHAFAGYRFINVPERAVQSFTVGVGFGI